MVIIIIESKTSNDRSDTLEDVFLKHILKSFFEVNDNSYKILHSGGWQNLKNMESEIKSSFDFDGENIVLILFDADSQQNHGGIINRNNQINKILKDITLEAQIFLFPNNKDDGDFEVLLENIVNTKHKGILDCFERYENCLLKYQKNGDNIYKTPNQKAKMFAYIDAFKKSNIQNEKMKNKSEWQFDNPEYWDLDNKYLEPLKLFLKEHIT